MADARNYATRAYRVWPSGLFCFVTQRRPIPNAIQWNPLSNTSYIDLQAREKTNPTKLQLAFTASLLLTRCCYHEVAFYPFLCRASCPLEENDAARTEFPFVKPLHPPPVLHPSQALKTRHGRSTYLLLFHQQHAQTIHLMKPHRNRIWTAPTGATYPPPPYLSTHQTHVDRIWGGGRHVCVAAPRKSFAVPPDPILFYSPRQRIQRKMSWRPSRPS